MSDRDRIVIPTQGWFFNLVRPRSLKSIREYVGMENFGYDPSGKYAGVDVRFLRTAKMNRGRYWVYGYDADGTTNVVMHGVGENGGIDHPLYEEAMQGKTIEEHLLTVDSVGDPPVTRRITFVFPYQVGDIGQECAIKQDAAGRPVHVADVHPHYRGYSGEQETVVDFKVVNSVAASVEQIKAALKDHGYPDHYRIII